MTIDTATIKEAARGKWTEILTALGGIDGGLLDGKHHPCPRCGGTDRFRVLDAEAGAVYCNQCFSAENGDGIAALGWLRDWNFATTVAALGSHLGINHNGDGQAGSLNIVATYDYRDEAGELLFQVVRLDPKSFRQRRPKDGGGWDWHVKGLRRVPYRLQQLLKADPSTTVYIVEGEKDADRAYNTGLVATSNAMGAGKWRPEHAEFLVGRRVAIIPDNDRDGREHARMVARSLVGKAAAVKIITLLGLPPKGDLSDWLDAGGTVEELKQLVEAAPEVTEKNLVETKVEPVTTGERIRNADAVKGEDGETDIKPIPMRRVVTMIRKGSGDWPRRVNNCLFVHEEADSVSWLETVPALFGWVGDRHGTVDWRQSVGCVTKGEVFAELQRTATSYRAVEELPHEPRFAGHYYACADIQPGDGKSLERFLNYFAHETPIDRQIHLALMATPLWGGPPGSRPAGLVTSVKGRGKGKSRAVQFIGLLYGHTLDVAANEDIEPLKKRFLSPEGLKVRIALLDNVKTIRFSWAELESLITADAISGHRMYTGEASRPNLLTWFITLNGASLSTDLAQRVVELRLADPIYTDAWEEDVRTFIREQRLAILGDIVAMLRKPAKRMRRHSRWAAWETGVLSRVVDPDACLDVILERQGKLDIEDEEGELIEDHFRGVLVWLDYDVDRDDVFIPADYAGRWFNTATGGNARTASVSRILKQFCDEGKITRLLPAREGGTGQRGFRWVGEKVGQADRIMGDIRQRMRDKVEARQDGKDKTDF